MSARFLLEFQATGDQEVVNKIREVGAAGKETAADLQELQHVEDPFAAIGTGAEGAVGPVTELGSAATTTGTDLTEMGSATETAATSTEGFGSSVSKMSGGIAAIGGTIGTIVSSLFRYNEIQLKVQKAQLASAKSAEFYRKSEEGIDKILASATGNTQALAAARDRLSMAQAGVNKLMAEGITSGSEYEAATTELQAAQRGLAAVAGVTGVNVSKLTSAMEKSELAAGRNIVKQKDLEATNREAQQSVLDLVFGFTSMGGTLVQSAGSIGNIIKGAKGLKESILDTIVPLAGMAGGVKGLTMAIGGPLLAALAAAYGAFVVFESVPQLFSTISAAATKDVKKTAEETLKLWEILRQGSQVIPGVGGVYDVLIPKLKEYVANATDVKDTTEETTPAFYDLEGRAKAAKDRFMELIKPTGDLEGAVLGTGDAAETTNQKFGSLDIGTQNLTESTMEFGNAADDNLVVTKQIASTIAALPGAIGNTVNDVELFTAAFQKQTGVITQSRDLLKNNEGVMIRSGGAFVQLGGTVKDLGNGLSTVNGVLVKNSDIVNKTGLSAEKAAERVMTLNDSIKASGGAFAGASSKVDVTNGVITDLAGSLATAKDKLADLKEAQADSTASASQLELALTNIKVGLEEEENALVAAIAATGNAEIQQDRLNNAYLEGEKAAREWIAGLDEAAAKEEAEIAILQEYADQFGELPDSIQPTIENLHAFIDANEKGGQAAIDFGQKALDAYGQMVEGAKGFLDSLTEAFQESGEEQVDAIQTAYDELLPGVEETLSEFERTAIESFKNMHAEIERGQQAFAANMAAGFAQGMNFDEALDNSRGALQSFLSDARSEMDSGWSEVFDSAQRIAATGSQQMIESMMTALKSDAPKEAVLAQLKKIETEGPGIGQRTGAGIGQGLTPAAGEAGKGAGIALSQEFAAAGTHIRSVIDGIKKNLATIGAKGAAKGINLGIYYRYYVIGKPPAPKPFNMGIYYRYYIVNARPNPPHLQRGIYYRYYIANNRPNPPNLQRTITYRYRTVGTRPAQMGMHENLAEDTLIAAHRGERVDITPGTVSSNENRTAIIPASGQASRPININVRGDINGKELIRFVRFNFMEGTGGVM